MITKNTNKRYFMLDFFRIACALAIFGRHAQTMGHYSFGGRLNLLFMSLTNSIMTCFFMISGFSLFLANKKYNLFEKKNIFFFYKKRAINILPVYYLVHFLYVLFVEKDGMKVIKLTPIELFGIQSIFNSLFAVLHNGGTWFISCLMIGYFVYPLIQEIIKSISLKAKTLLLFIITFLAIYLPCISGMQQETLYSNPFYRCIQFSLGVALASVCEWEKIKFKKNSLFPYLLCGGSAIIVILSMYKTITVLQRFDVLFISIVILFSTQIECSILEQSKVLRYISGLTYEFYILQLFLWIPSLLIVNFWGLGDFKYKVIIPFVLLLAASIFVHELYEKPIQRKLSSKFLKH